MWGQGTWGRSSLPIATRRREWVCSVTCFEMLMKGLESVNVLCGCTGDCFADLLARTIFFQLTQCLWHNLARQDVC